MNVRTPQFRSMCQAQNRYRYSCTLISWGWGCPKIVHHSDPISLLISTFGIHLEPGCKSQGQIIHYRSAKNVQKQATVFLHFRQVLIT